MKALVAEVPEGRDDDYVEIKSGKHKAKFRLKVEDVDGWALEDVGALKRSLSDARDELKTAKAAGPELEDGEDLVELRKAKKTLDDLGDPKKLKNADEVERMKATLEVKHKKDLEERDGRIAKLTTSSVQGLKARAADEAMEAAGVVRGKKGVRSYLMGQMDVVDEDGTDVVRMRDPEHAGKHLPSTEAGRLYASANEVAKGMAEGEEWGDFFDSEIAGGTGSGGPGTGGPKRGGTKGQVVLSSDDARDSAKYEVARERAVKEGKDLVVQPDEGQGAAFSGSSE